MSAKKLTLEEQKEIEIYVLKVRDKYLEEENKKDKKAFKNATCKTIYDLKGEYPVKQLLQIFGMPKSNYYNWLNREPSKRDIENEELKKDILDIYHKSNETYGYRRIYHYIREELGKPVNHKRIQRLMNELGLKGQSHEKKKE